jgi:hypothetical protein
MFRFVVPAQILARRKALDPKRETNNERDSIYRGRLRSAGAVSQPVGRVSDEPTNWFPKISIASQSMIKTLIPGSHMLRCIER